LSPASPADAGRHGQRDDVLPVDLVPSPSSHPSTIAVLERCTIGGAITRGGRRFRMLSYTSHLMTPGGSSA
jgi:hypothetical protein